MNTEEKVMLGLGGAALVCLVFAGIDKKRNLIGGYYNASGQYISIEKALIEAQKKRDRIVDNLSVANTKLDSSKATILDILGSFEFKKGPLLSHAFFGGNTDFLNPNQLELEKGLVFEPSTGKVKTSTNTWITDIATFLNYRNLGYKCMFDNPPTGDKGTYCIPDYGVNQNPAWKNLSASFLSEVSYYRTLLLNVSTLKSQLAASQKQVDNLKKDLDAAAKQDPALLAAARKAEADEKAAKIAADLEVEKLRITKQADADALAAKSKQTTKRIIIGASILGLAVVTGLMLKK